MKILFVFHLPSGGVETLNRQRNVALKDFHCEFLYFQNEKSGINDHGAPVYITNNDMEIKNIISKGNYDLVVVTSAYQAMPRLRNLGYKGPFIFEIQGGQYEDLKNMLINGNKTIMTQAKGILTPVTPYIIELTKKLLPALPRYSYNNCINVTSNSANANITSPKSPYVAWIGRIQENKNWREFLLLGKKLIEYNSNIKLCMFVDPVLSTPNDRNEFKKKIEELGFGNNLMLLTDVKNDEMKEQFMKIGNSGGFLCITSKYEGATTYVALEAMTSDCPVLTTDCNGIRAAVIHNITGKYYQIGNIKDAYMQSIELMSDLSLRKKIIQNASTHIRENFSSERYASNFNIMLRSLGFKNI
ncbi:glycosyltransferase [Rossellomorea vietnamensis]|uniref:Glycosyltransferase n=1 Tax=Rossellomorea vietnamensis TaxID=218284 RepID=A0ACD4C9I6_9BACI|nr:glycosyltransferase [Rossellomorea vietnamensis]UXH45330.1 glycosyltransferase [Rossellomorea vietnamensis]